MQATDPNISLVVEGPAVGDACGEGKATTVESGK